MTPQEAEAIALAAKSLPGFIGTLYNWRHEANLTKQAQIKAALTSLVLAATETRQYLAQVRDDKASASREKEYILSRLWSIAAMDMHVIDARIADTYLLKADYWSDPYGWTQAQKDEREIELDDVYRGGRDALLGP